MNADGADAMAAEMSAPAPVHTADIGNRRRAFRWRVIPVTVLALYGVSFFGGEIVAAGFILRWMIDTIQEPTGWISPPERFFQYVVLGHVGGMTLISAACLWWRGRWWVALALVAIFFAAGETAARLGLIPP